MKPPALGLHELRHVRFPRLNRWGLIEAPYKGESMTTVWQVSPPE